ncbi:MAG: response regulator [Odoribacteraceae bacterium]|jgi:signal transduction histidine kinase/ligand-binding sensor domain-containing protein/DNA-binding response OmpR family regulator|nr:response regulator [Odoribacteraceae bacterium]
MKTCFKLSVLLVMSAVHVGTCAEAFRFRHYEVSDGLAANTVRSLVQDSRGFMWFGTENGLSRFDGRSFKNFRSARGDSTSLGNNFVYALHEDARQRLWVGTDGGVYIHDPRTERFSFFAAATPGGETIRGHVEDIVSDRRGHVWISTYLQGVFRYDPGSNALHQYRDAGGDDGSPDANLILSLYIDKQNVTWVSTRGGRGALGRFDPGQDKFIPMYFRAGDADPATIGVYAMLEDSANNFWLGTWNHGLCLLDRETGEIRSFLAPGSPGGISHVHEIIEHAPGILLVGSDDGLVAFNTATHEAEPAGDGLSDKFVYPVYRDVEGGLWVGTYYGGVNYAPPTRIDIAGYARSARDNSVGGNIISCFREDRHGNIWIGSDDGGLSRFDPVTKTFTNFMPSKNRNSLSYYNIHALCFLDDDELWIGTYSGGLNVLDTRTGTFRCYHTRAGDTLSIPDESVYSLYKDGDDMWVGTMKGICRYAPRAGHFTREKSLGTTVIDITGDAENIWFATWESGLLRLDKAANRWHHYTHDPGDASSIPDDQVNSVYLDDDGTLWVGTDRGLASREKGRDAFATHPVDGDNGSIRYLVKVDGYLWLATGNGLVRYDPRDGTTRKFHKSDGLLGDLFNKKAGLLSRAGDLYLGTTNGFNVIKPGHVPDNDHVPPVHVTAVQVFNEDLPVDARGLAAPFAGRIDLSSRENVFSVEYAALSYASPYKNRYKYRLEGFDKEWNVVGNQRKATYTSLPAGRYVFHVTGSNNDGAWNERGARLVIVIHPPFWRTTWAYVLYGAFLLGASAWAVRRARRVTGEKHEARLRQLEIEKDKELHEAKINFFTLVAHEIRTPVTLIIGPLEKIMEDPRDVPAFVRENLRVVDRNSQRLLSLVNQLLDFRKAEEKAFVIKFSPCDVRELARNVYERFRPLVEQKEITFRLETGDEEVEAVVDAEALTKILSNLLTNALKYTRDAITIRVVPGPRHVIVEVTDNGIGIEEKDRREVFRPFYQVARNRDSGTGIGLSLVQLLVDAHGGTIEIDSEPGRFTTFTVTLPREQAGFTPPGEEPLLADDLPARAILPSRRENKPVVLLVEDNPDMRDFLRQALGDDYVAIEAKNGQEGLAALDRHVVDVIVADIMMPVMDGLSFAREVKGNIEYNHVPLVLLTARTDKETKEEAMRSGADAYVEKPFSTRLLRAQVENLVESRRRLRKRFSEMPFMPVSGVTENKADKQFLANMGQLIEDNITNPDFSVDVLAARLYISRSGLFAKMKSLAGVTPNEFIQLTRLRKAAEMLAAGESRVNEICYQAGFNNPSYFTKCFRKQFGMSPKEFVNRKK